MIEKNKYAITFRRFLRDFSDTSDTASICSRLFSLKADEQLELLLKDLHHISTGKDPYFGKWGKENWMIHFLKMLRQTDFFEGCYKKQYLKILKADERKRMYELKKLFYDKSVSDEEREKLKKSHPDDLREYFTLSNKLEQETQPESIGGHLDMILRDVINSDTKGQIEKIFKYTFLEAEEGFLFFD